MPPVRPLASAMPLQLADMEIRTIFDTAFAGEFLLTPVLLATTDLPVETVAEQVGYRSLSGFFIAFRRRYGVGASEYRRKFAETFETETSFL